MPMFLISQDVSPLSPATSSASNRDQNERENQQPIEMLSPANDRIDLVLVSCGVTKKLPCSCWDVGYVMTDHFFQFTAATFEFVDSVGSVSPSKSTPDWEPGWWQDLVGKLTVDNRSRPIVLVTQGTIANQDLSELIEPTLMGLADQDLTVIVAMGGVSPDKIAITIPDNAKVVSFIPFALALPEVDVFVTNGGYGGVQQSLSLGVPIVVAGAAVCGGSSGLVWCRHRSGYRSTDPRTDRYGGAGYLDQTDVSDSGATTPA
jgi:UDP:flavonoid glycosyltransferase YjiC (YdhE family)